MLPLILASAANTWFRFRSAWKYFCLTQRAPFVGCQRMAILSLNDHPDIRRVFARFQTDLTGINYTVGAAEKLWSGRNSLFIAGIRQHIQPDCSDVRRWQTSAQRRYCWSRSHGNGQNHTSTACQ